MKYLSTISKKLPLIALFSVISFNLFLASRPDFFTHLQTDVVTFYYRSHYFFLHGNFANLGSNEYQPGALVFFALLSFILKVKNDFAFYKYSLFVANIIFSVLIYICYKKYNKRASLFIYSLILFSTGPIFLFRFDLYVVLFVIASFIFWQRKRNNTSLLLLAWATLIKVYPLVFLPYYMLIGYRNKGIISSFKIAGKYLAYTLIILVAYMFIFKVTFVDLISSWSFLSNQPVNTEGLWGNILSLYSLIFKGRMAHGLGNWGVFGISPKDTIGPLWFYSLFPFIVLTLFYLRIFVRDSNKALEIKIPIAIILTFLMFSKVMQHQYTLWYVMLLPLLPHENFIKYKYWWFNLCLVILSSLLFVYVYPLHYRDIVGKVYVSGESIYLFWITVLKNILMVILWFRVVYDVLRPRSEFDST